VEDEEQRYYGVGKDYLDSMPPGSVVAFRGEPSAMELAMLRYSLDEGKRRQFDESIARAVDWTRRMTAQERAELLARLTAAAPDDAPVVIPTEEVKSSEEGTGEIQIGRGGPSRSPETGGPPRRFDLFRNMFNRPRQTSRNPYERSAKTQDQLDLS